MDFTTLARVKARISESTTAQDALLQQMISAVSVEMERAMCRYAQATQRTEVVSFPSSSRLAVLRGFPVQTTSADGRTSLPFTVKISDTPTFSSVTSAVQNTDYTLEPESGIVRILGGYTPVRSQGGRALAPLYAQVTYTGGMAADTTAFILAYPDLAQACDDQVSYAHQRKNSMGGNSTVGDGGSAIFTEGYTFLPSVRRAIALYGSLRF